MTMILLFVASIIGAAYLRPSALEEKRLAEAARAASLFRFSAS